MIGLPFGKLTIVKAKDAGRIAFVDDATEPSRAFSTDADLVRWLQDELRGSALQRSDHDGGITADEIAANLRDNDATGEVVELKPSSTLNVAERFGFRRNK